MGFSEIYLIGVDHNYQKIINDEGEVVVDNSVKDYFCEGYDEDIKDKVVAYAFGVVDAEQIDDINIYEASRVAMKQAIENLSVQVDGLLIDAMTVDLPLPQEKLIKGDDRSISIGAASILAKNFRDELMVAYAVDYPGYGFEHNAGYGTAEHLAGLAAHGVTPIHRKTFAPVKNYLN